MTSIKSFVRSHPLLSVLLAALSIRILAVIWSQGFIHSDDHYDTIAVAWDWLHGGLWGADGWLRWKHKAADTIGRFPLYTLFLLAQMKLCQWVGLVSLDKMMYVVRFFHALLSLLPVWAGYRIVWMSTRSERWAVGAGLIVAFHFALPFLGVRNLIEVVGGSLWLAAVMYLYRWLNERKVGWLYLAGFFTGLAWMIRFPMAFAALPIPILLWWEERRIVPVIHYSVSVAAMLLISGLADWLLLGRFGGSTLTNLAMNAALGPLYRTIPLMYIVLLVFLLVPPVSLVLPFMFFRRSFIRAGGILFWSSISFVVIHCLYANQQERFIFPIVPALVVMSVLAVRHYVNNVRSDGVFPRWLRRTAWVSFYVNLVLAGFLTFAYGHKGMIEPLKWFEKNAPAARVLFVQPEVKRWVPIEYAGRLLHPDYVRDWGGLKWWPPGPQNPSAFDYFVIYPRTDSSLSACLDSLTVRFGPLEPVFEVSPSFYDQTLHLLNPHHNDNFAAFVYRPRPTQN